MTNNNEALKKIQTALAEVNIKNTEIYLSHRVGETIELRGQEIETKENEVSLSFAVRFLQEGRMGFVSGTDLSPTALIALFQNALEMTAYADPEPLAGFVAPSASVQDPKNNDPQFSEISFEPIKKYLKTLEKTVLDFSPQIQSVRYCTLGAYKTSYRLVNYLGLDQSWSNTAYQSSVMAVASHNDISESSYDVDISAFFSELNPTVLAKRSAQHALDLLGGVRLANYHGPVILHSRIVADMLGLIGQSACGDQIYKKNSYWAGKLGQNLYSSAINLTDEGCRTGSPFAAPVDDEGTPRQTTTLIKAGRVNQFLYDSLYAKIDNTQPTGNAVRGAGRPHIEPHQLVLQTGSRSIESIFKDLNNGLYITDAIGMHMADAVSGDFSVGVNGFVIKNGKIDTPFRGMALTGTVHDILKNTLEVASDQTWYGSTGSASLLVKEASVSGG